MITHAQLYTFNYAAYGFPAPQNPNPVLSAAKYTNFKTLWNNYMGVQAVKAGQILGVDPGMIGGWTLHEGIESTFFDNCQDNEVDPNTPCMSNNWQVGYGVRVMEQLGSLKESITAMHPSESLQQIGDAIIAASKTRDASHAITNPSTFPSVTIDQILASPDTAANRQLLGILVKDDAIGTYMVGKIIEGYMNSGTGMAASFAAWGSYYAPQKVSDSFDAAYQAGVPSGSGTTGGTSRDDDLLAIFRETTFYESNGGTATTNSQGVVSIAQQEYEKNKGKLAFSDNPNMVFTGSDYTNGVGGDGAHWCAWFVSWVFKQAGLAFTDGTNGWEIPGVPALIAYFQNKQTVILAGVGDPQPGDVIFYTTTKGDPATGSHVEIVISYDATSRQITYVGGNECSGTVTGCNPPYSEIVMSTINTSNGYGSIYGFGRYTR